MYIKRAALLSVSTLLSSYAFSQSTYTVKGKLADTAEFKAVQNSSIVVINQDSIITAFTRAAGDGSFELKVPEKGKYGILINHPEFAIYNDNFNVSSFDTDLGEIPLTNKKKLLEEVVIQAKKAILIKGDTVEYAADSFKVREFDNVDELLKRLPGIEVNKDGSIVAHGEKVQKMFVDGEEFFSDDPAVLAKTLRASAIDRVQVFDDKTEKSKNTGVDDGEKVKTINLVLKDDAKKGYMGKLAAGYGHPDYYETEGMIQSYAKKRKFSVYGIGSNTYNNQLDWQSSRDFGSNEITMTEDGGFSSSYSSDGDLSANGLPKVFNGGVAYSNKWLEDKLSVNANYTIKDYSIERLNNTTTQYILPDTQYYYLNKSTSDNNTVSQNAIVRVEYKIDSLTEMKLNFRGSAKNTDFTTATGTRTETLDGAVINTGERSTNGSSDTKNASAELYFIKRFKREGRSLSINLNTSFNDVNGNTSFRSSNTFETIGTSVNFLQNKKNDASSNVIGTNINYTEPLTKKWNLELSYLLSVNNNKNSLSTYDIDNQQETFNSRYSTDYEYNFTTHRGGANIRYNYEKLMFVAGLGVGNTHFVQNDFLANNKLSYDQLNFFPNARLKYKINGQQNLDFSYNGATNQPTISQIRPMVVNDDPTYLIQGNPDLKQEFVHNFNLRYQNNNILKNRFLYANLSNTFTSNAIAQTQFVDANGVNTISYDNVSGNNNLSGYFGMYKKISKNSGVHASVSGSYSENKNFINGLENNNRLTTFAPSVGINFAKDTLINFYYSIQPRYNSTKSSIREDVAINYWSMTNSLNGSMQLPYGFRLGADITWDVRQKLNESQGRNNVFLFSPSVSKRFLSDRSLEAKLYAFDLFNQNLGYNYYQAQTYITEQRYNIITRYVMFKLTWNFTSMGIKKATAASESVSNL